MAFAFFVLCLFGIYRRHAAPFAVRCKRLSLLSFSLSFGRSKPMDVTCLRGLTYDFLTLSSLHFAVVERISVSANHFPIDEKIREEEDWRSSLLLIITGLNWQISGTFYKGLCKTHVGRKKKKKKEFKHLSFFVPSFKRRYLNNNYSLLLIKFIIYSSSFLTRQNKQTNKFFLSVIDQSSTTTTTLKWWVALNFIRDSQHMLLVDIK